MNKQVGKRLVLGTALFLLMIPRYLYSAEINHDSYIEKLTESSTIIRKIGEENAIKKQLHAKDSLDLHTVDFLVSSYNVMSSDTREAFLVTEHKNKIISNETIHKPYQNQGKIIVGLLFSVLIIGMIILLKKVNMYK